MDSTPFALDSQNIQKKFGYAVALRKFTLQIRRGEFVAFFGRNGAGKTTFLKIAATLMRPTGGTLRIEGIDSTQEPELARQKIGFLSHNTFVYRDLTAIDNLKFFARLYGVDDSDERLMGIIKRVGLERRARDRVRSFSRGLQQRIGIARVLLHDPALILLDEPYTGLDAQAAATLNDLLDEAVGAGKTVVLTTHDLDQGLRGASRAIIVDKGMVAYSGSPASSEIREAYNQLIRFGENR